MEADEGGFSGGIAGELVSEEFLHCEKQDVDARRRAMLDAWCDLLESAQKGRLIVHGRSMMPALCPGWSLIVRPVSVERLRSGDVVVFLLGSRLIAHRIAAVLGWGRHRSLFEKGDAGGKARRLDRTQVVGRVEQVLDDSGEPVSAESWRWKRVRATVVSWVVLARLFARKVRRVAWE